MELTPTEGGSVVSNVARGVVALLVLIALALGYFLYRELSSPIIEEPPVVPSTNPAELPAPSEAERKALETPMMPEGGAAGDLFGGPKKSSANASDEVFFRSSGTFESIAVATDTLTIGAKCRVKPVVLKTKKGAQLTVKNIDTVQHRLQLSSTHSVLIPAGGTTTMAVNFGTVGATYQFGCESEPTAVGLLWIAE